MKRLLTLSFLAAACTLLAAQEKSQPSQPEKKPEEKKDAKPVLIAPGEFRRDASRQRMRGQLASVDLKTRTGTFIRDGDGEKIAFTLLPHATLLHHLSLGDLSDYIPGQRLAFFMYESASGKFDLLGLAQEELQELHAHKEYYFVEAIEPDGVLKCVRASADKKNRVWENLRLATTKETKYWKGGKRDGSFADLRVGDKFYAKTYGGKGLLDRKVSDILDDETLLAWQAEQNKLLEVRLKTDGIPGYVVKQDSDTLHLNLFPEATAYLLRSKVRPLTVRTKVEAAVAGPDRLAKAEKVAGTITALKVTYLRGDQYFEIAVALNPDQKAKLRPATVVRVQPVK